MALTNNSFPSPPQVLNNIRIFEYGDMAEKEKDDRIYQLHADLCQMLSNPTRLEIIEELREGEKSVSELVSAIGVRQANLSQHLSELRKRNLVVTRREGTNVYYEIAYPKIFEACDLVREVLFEQLSESKELIEGGAEK